MILELQYALADHAKRKKDDDAVKKITTFFYSCQKTDKCEKENKSNRNKKQETLD